MVRTIDAATGEEGEVREDGTGGGGSWAASKNNNSNNGNNNNNADHDGDGDNDRPSLLGLLLLPTGGGGSRGGGAAAPAVASERECTRLTGAHSLAEGALAMVKHLGDGAKKLTPLFTK